MSLDQLNQQKSELQSYIVSVNAALRDPKYQSQYSELRKNRTSATGRLKTINKHIRKESRISGFRKHIS